jgi:hypothetical protein
LQAFFAAFSATLRFRNSKTGGVMADKSKIRYDDFISNVQPDPAKPESTIMLSGFVGHGPEGHARIYPDPTLGSWYDVPEDDVVHSMPVADSKLGGSYLWVRASAQIKPGSAAPAATEAVQPKQAAAIGIHPTPATHCFVCDPPNMQPTPTVQTHCFICPPLTQQANCPTHPAPCNIPPTPATHCFICPPHQTPNCTLPTVCTMPPACPPPPPTPATLCLICPLPNVWTKWPVCPIGPLGGPTFITLEPACATLLGCPPTSPPGCPPQGGAQQEAVAAAPAHPNTAATVCTMPPACPATAHTLCCLLTQPPLCPPPGGGFTHVTQCICLTPVNTMACFTLGGCLTLGICPTAACATVVTCTPNGIFTPFGR